MLENDSPIDIHSAALADRDRPQQAAHIRNIEVQILDALLRIEELLTPKVEKAEEKPEEPKAPQINKNNNSRKGRTL